MNIVYELQSVEFEWNNTKAASNIEKHNITFTEAAEVFFDPFYQEGDASAVTEQRNFIIGYSLSQRILLVVVYLLKKARRRWLSPKFREDTSYTNHISPPGNLFGKSAI